MIVLALEPSGPNISLGLAINGSIYNEPVKNPPSIHISNALHSIFHSHKLDITDVSFLAIGVGPGSFTSLRVGIAFIQGIIFSTQKPFCTVSSLEILANHETNKELTNVTAVISARHLDAFVESYERNHENKFVSLGPPILHPIKEIIQNFTHTPLIVSPNQSQLNVWKDLSKTSSNSISIQSPCASTLAFIAQNRYTTKDLQKKWTHVTTLVPDYVRTPEYIRAT